MVVICKRRTLPAELIENCFELINLLIVFACWAFLSAVGGYKVYVKRSGRSQRGNKRTVIGAKLRSLQ